MIRQDFTDVERQKVLDEVSNNGRLLQNLTEKFKNDKEIVLAAVSSYPQSLQFASQELKKDKEIALKAVKRNGMSK
jgi:hypothetical protein